MVVNNLVCSLSRGEGIRPARDRWIICFDMNRHLKYSHFDKGIKELK